MMVNDDRLVLVFDAGTQSTRGFLFNRKGDIVASAKTKNHISDESDIPNRHEKDAEEYWREISRVSLELKEISGDNWDKVIAVSVTMLRNCYLCVDKDAKPLRPVITWLDQRLAKFDNPYRLANRLLYGIAGMKATSIAQYETSFANWIKQNEPEIWKKTYKFVPISAYINYKFTGRLVDSKGNTLGRIPYDYKKRTWMSEKNIRFPVFGVDRDKCGDIIEPCERLGYVTAECSRLTGIKEGLPVIATGSDKACEAIGSGVVGDEIASLSFGTAACVQMTVDKHINPQPFMPSFTAAAPNMFNPEIQMFRGFWMITWFKEQFADAERKIADDMGVPTEVLLDEMLNKVPAGSNGLILQPYWGPGLIMPRAKGSIIGFSDVHTKAHIYRAIIEGLGYALYDGLKEIEKRGRYNVKRIAVSGGGSTSDAICQIAADIFGREVVRTHTSETSGLGSAIVTFLAMGEYKDVYEAIDNMVRVRDVFKPNMENNKLYMNIYGKVYSKLYTNLRRLFEKLYNIV